MLQDQQRILDIYLPVAVCIAAQAILFTADQRDAMREELIAHPQLIRCMELAPDADAYMRRYLEKLGVELG